MKATEIALVIVGIIVVFLSFADLTDIAKKANFLNTAEKETWQFISGFLWNLKR